MAGRFLMYQAGNPRLCSFAANGPAEASLSFRISGKDNPQMKLKAFRLSAVLAATLAVLVLSTPATSGASGDDDPPGDDSGGSGGGGSDDDNSGPGGGGGGGNNDDDNSSGGGGGGGNDDDDDNSSGGGGDDSGGGGDDNDFKILAKLFGSTTMSGKGLYRVRPKDGTIEERFKIEIEDGPAGELLDVHINGQFIVTLTLNNNGFVEFQYRTAQFIDDPGDGLPMPDDFPTIGTGDVLTIGPLSGIFFVKESGGSSDDVPVQKLRLEAETDGNDGAEFKARYRERFKNGGLMRRFDLEVEDAPDGAVYDIVINGQFIGEIEIDDNEEEFQLRTAAFLDDPGDGEPMPDSFPSLMAGDVIEVGPMSAVFQPD
jgi:hypothetical protein